MTITPNWSAGLGRPPLHCLPDPCARSRTIRCSLGMIRAWSRRAPGWRPWPAALPRDRPVKRPPWWLGRNSHPMANELLEHDRVHRVWDHRDSVPPLLTVNRGNFRPTPCEAPRPVTPPDIPSAPEAPGIRHPVRHQRGSVGSDWPRACSLQNPPEARTLPSWPDTATRATTKFSARRLRHCLPPSTIPTAHTGSLCVDFPGTQRRPYAPSERGFASQRAPHGSRAQLQ
ncbi:hypothetical protein J2S32_000001 [Qipengyuania citrea]|nr:hypothetical protein [Qipengyuania citrea]